MLVQNKCSFFLLVKRKGRGGERKKAEKYKGMAESEEELKNLLMRMKEESKSVSLKLNTEKTKIMASSPITVWQLEGEKVKVVTDILFLGSKITMDGDYSHEIRRQLFLGRKAMTNLDSVVKSRDITTPTKVCIVKAMVFQRSCTVVRIGL